MRAAVDHQVPPGASCRRRCASDGCFRSGRFARFIGEHPELGQNGVLERAFGSFNTSSTEGGPSTSTAMPVKPAPEPETLTPS